MVLGGMQPITVTHAVGNANIRQRVTGEAVRLVYATTMAGYHELSDIDRVVTVGGLCTRDGTQHLSGTNPIWFSAHDHLTNVP